MTALTDSLARERAATVMDRNLVVTAGAGTGKTTLLVDRLTHLLFRSPDPLPIGEIVALTFTNKAANEMKVRLRERLNLWLSLDPANAPTGSSTRREWEQMMDVLARYVLAKPQLNDLASKAMRELEKSQIGTIHSFAAHLLRLYPRECGVDPAFVEDDGTQFNEHLDREWALWLDEELGPGGTNHPVWREALGLLRLDDIKNLATQLSNELIPLDEAARHVRHETTPLPPGIRVWLESLAAHAVRLRKDRPKVTTIERMLEAAADFLRDLAGGRLMSREAEDDLGFDRRVPCRTKAWTREEYREAKALLRTAWTLAHLDAGPLPAFLPCLIGFAETCRRRFIERGLVSYDGLLARSRDLLRDYPAIRRALKAQFNALLVDEFQDTDPVQYELILYLAEAEGEEARHWQDLRLEPGKLFIVGDPKQSIYAFRRADIQAYDAVVDDLVLVQGDRETLETNFRSHDRVLAPINACFARLFPNTPVKGLQPRNEPLVVANSSLPPLPGEGVEIRLVRPESEEADADTATRCEAEAVARWLREEVFDRQEIRETDATVKIKPRHVAILFRTLTHGRDYLEALRRYEIPYLTEGEKHFYARQEVIDAVNLLRATADPHDQIALVGVLRAPLGGLTDRDLERLARAGKLDYRLDPEPEVGAAVRIYALLRDLQVRLPRIPVVEAMEEIFSATPLMELAAASVDGEQAVANLRKLRTLVVDMAARADVSWHSLIRSLTDRVADPPDEAESPLAEEGVENENHDGAVRVLSIHKAKGLEFPLVILAGMHRGKDRRQDRVFVKHDWASGLVGIRAGAAQTLAGIYIDAKLAEREQAEQRRVLYVAMTRARRRLILSAGIPSNTRRLGDSFLALLAEGFGVDLLEQSGGTLTVKDQEIPLAVIPGREVPLTRSGYESKWVESAEDSTTQQGRWEERTQRWRDATTAIRFHTPGRLMAKTETGLAVSSDSGSADDTERARDLGILIHRILEPWDFAGGPGQLDACLEMAGAGMPPELRCAAGDILSTFLASDLYTELQSATIIGREVPFLMPWTAPDSRHSSLVTRHPVLSVMEGVIDLIYELDGQFWIADYKTDRFIGKQENRDAEVRTRAERYRTQLGVYREAVEKALGVSNVRAQVVFLRLGRAVEVRWGNENVGVR